MRGTGPAAPDLPRGRRRPREPDPGRQLQSLLRWRYTHGYVDLADLYESHRRLQVFGYDELVNAVYSARHRGDYRFHARATDDGIEVALREHLRRTRRGRGPPDIPPRGDTSDESSEDSDQGTQTGAPPGSSATVAEPGEEPAPVASQAFRPSGGSLVPGSGEVRSDAAASSSSPDAVQPGESAAQCTQAYGDSLARGSAGDGENAAATQEYAASVGPGGAVDGSLRTPPPVQEIAASEGSLGVVHHPGPRGSVLSQLLGANQSIGLLDPDYVCVAHGGRRCALCIVAWRKNLFRDRP